MVTSNANAQDEDTANCEKYFNNKDFQQAVQSCTAAAERLDEAAIFFLGKMYSNGDGVRQSFPIAAELYSLSAGMGFAEAQNHLAALYYNGIAVRQSDSEAKRWFELAAIQGHVLAQINLAMMYEEDFEEGKEDLSKAIFWYNTAAEQGHPVAQYKLANFYFFGKGVVQNYQSAFNLYKNAADQGFVLAQSELGSMYTNGLAVEVNLVEAIRLYRIAAVQGLAIAQYNLANMYFGGHGIDQSDFLAYMWANIATSNGADDIAAEILFRARFRMTREQIAEAQTRAQRCVDSNYLDC